MPATVPREGGCFVTHPHEIAKQYVCGLCNPPARAAAGDSVAVTAFCLSSLGITRSQAKKLGSWRLR